jgi:predicted nucleic acid-binding protein
MTLIEGHALADGFTLLSGNRKHFAPIPGLRITPFEVV